MRRGLPALRAAWIEGRGDTELYTGRERKALDDGNRHEEREAQRIAALRAEAAALQRQPRRARSGAGALIDGDLSVNYVDLQRHSAERDDPGGDVVDRNEAAFEFLVSLRMSWQESMKARFRQQAKAIPRRVFYFDESFSS